MWKILLAYTLVLAPRIAAAKTVADTYDHFVGDQASKDAKVQGYEMPPGLYVTHVIVGQSATSFSRLVLLHCDSKKCAGTDLMLGPPGTTVESIMAVDLHGDASVATPVRPNFYGRFDLLPWSNVPRASKAKKAKAMVTPALVITTMRQTTAQDTYRDGSVANGADSDGQMQMFDLRATSLTRMFQGPTLRRGATGAGVSTTYTLVRNDQHVLLDLVASHQRLVDRHSGCLPPGPVLVTYQLKAGRYILPGEAPNVGGC